MPRLISAAFIALSLALTSACVGPNDPNGCSQREELTLEDIALPDAVIGDEYDQEVPASGLGSIVLEDGAALPDGLELVEDGGGFFIRGEATTASEDTVITFVGSEFGTQCVGRSASFDVILSVVEADLE